jgi:hypothetical protein
VLLRFDRVVYDSMNPNYSLKEEIEYELHICGISIEGDVQLLRKIFPSVVTESIPTDLTHLGDFNPYAHLAILRVRYRSWSSWWTSRHQVLFPPVLVSVP